jgi:NTF2 fold immunity protein
MNTSNAIETAVAVLYEFMREMNIWETKYHALCSQPGGSIHFPQAREDLNVVYLKYLTKRDRKLGRQTALAPGFPPDFDPMRENIEQSEIIENGKAVISTLWNHPTSPAAKRSHRYTMVFKNGSWLLDRKERFSKVDNKWINVVL